MLAAQQEYKAYIGDMEIGFAKPEPLDISIERIRPDKDDTQSEGWHVISETAECIIGVESHFRILVKFDRKAAWRFHPAKWSQECRKIKRRLRQ